MQYLPSTICPYQWIAMWDRKGKWEILYQRCILLRVHAHIKSFKFFYSTIPKLKYQAINGPNSTLTCAFKKLISSVKCFAGKRLRLKLVERTIGWFLLFFFASVRLSKVTLPFSTESGGLHLQVWLISIVHWQRVTCTTHIGACPHAHVQRMHTVSWYTTPLITTPTATHVSRVRARRHRSGNDRQ